MNLSEVETTRPFRSVKEAAAAFGKRHSTFSLREGSGSGTGTGSGQKSIPDYYEVTVMDSIKSLEMELTEMRQEMALMKKRRSEMEIAMAGINAQFHRSLSQLAELEAAQAAQRSAAREEKRWEEDDNDYWPCFADALSISDMDTGMEKRMERKVQKEKHVVPLFGGIFSKKKRSTDAIDYSYPESIYSVLS